MNQTHRRRNITIGLALALLALLALLAWQALARRGGSDGQTATVRRGTLKTTIETSGRLVARRTSGISSPASGAVRIVAVREGEGVQRGDVLVVLDDATARADVLRAERAVEAAETRVGVARQRAESNPSALADIATAEADAASTRAALVAATDRLAATLVLAPFDGVITALRVGEGATYGAGGEIATIADPTDLAVTADIDEVDRPLVSEGQEAGVTVTAFPATTFTGRITALSATSQSRGGSTVYPAQLAITRPADAPLALLPGMTVDVRIVTAARDGVLIVPSNAIRRAGERQYVVVRRDGREEDVEIRTGARSGGDVEIADGLREGEVVVLR